MDDEASTHTCAPNKVVETHSQLPWTVENDGTQWIFDASGILVTDMHGYQEVATGWADGNFIVTAVNAHYALVEALEEHVKWAIDPCDCGFVCDCDRSGPTRKAIQHRADCPVPKSLAALALAKGGVE